MPAPPTTPAAPIQSLTEADAGRSIELRFGDIRAPHRVQWLTDNGSIFAAYRTLEIAAALNLEPEDAFPPVFATSRMVALMELAAARVLRPHLRPGELSVGVTLDVVHTAATPPGATVSATAKFLGREGKLFVFEVTAADGTRPLPLREGQDSRMRSTRRLFATE